MRILQEEIQLGQSPNELFPRFSIVPQNRKVIEQNRANLTTADEIEEGAYGWFSNDQEIIELKPAPFEIIAVRRCGKVKNGNGLWRFHFPSLGATEDLVGERQFPGGSLSREQRDLIHRHARIAQDMIQRWETGWNRWEIFLEVARVDDDTCAPPFLQPCHSEIQLTLLHRCHQRGHGASIRVHRTTSSPYSTPVLQSLWRNYLFRGSDSRGTRSWKRGMSKLLIPGRPKNLVADLDFGRRNYCSGIAEFGDNMLEFAAGVNIHLSVDALKMIADRAVAKKELSCDRFVALALRN
jgi:hypothetical protein